MAWEPAEGGQELLRFSGRGLDTWSVQTPRFAGNTLVYNANVGEAGTTHRFTVAPGQDSPRASAVIAGEDGELGRLVSGGVTYTTTKVGNASVVHRIQGGRSTLLGSAQADMVPVLVRGGTLILRNEKTDSTATFVLATGIASLWPTKSRFIGVFGERVLYSEDLDPGTSWRWLESSGFTQIAYGVDGQLGAAGVGRLRSGIEVPGGVVVVANHAAHQQELWLIPADGSTPVLLTNLNDTNVSLLLYPLTILGVQDGKVIFSQYKSIYSIGTVPYSETKLATASSEFLTGVGTVGRTVLFRQPEGLMALGPGGSSLTRLVSGDVRSVTTAADGKTALAVVEFGSQTTLWRTDGSVAGTRQVKGTTAAGYAFTSSTARAVEGPGGQIAFTQASQGAQQLFLLRPDRTVRLAKVSAVAKQRQPKGKVALKVSAGASEKVTSTVSGTVKLPGVKKKISLKGATLTTAKDRSGTVTLTVPKSKRAKVTKVVKKYRATKKKSLKKKRKVVATIKVVVKDANAGNTITRTLTVRLT